MAKATITSLDDEPNKGDTAAPNGVQGPPPGPKPKPASDTSLYSTAGKNALAAGQSGLGEEGSQPALVGVQGMALIQRGIQMLNLSFPDNPGLVAVLADLTGRLQSIVPQLVAQSSNSGMGLLGNMAQGLQGPMQQGMQPGMPPGQGGPPGMPPGAPPMGPQGPPMGPPGSPATMVPGQLQYPPVPG